jgi:virginiamycin A acetyltransferase
MRPHRRLFWTRSLAALLAPVRWSGRFPQGLLQAASLWPGRLGVLMRAALLQTLGISSRGNTYVEFGTIFSDGRVRLGETSYLGAYCNIGWAEVGDNVLIGSNVHLISGRRTHCFDRTDIPIAQQGGRKEQIRIGNGSWIGNGALIMADVGEECVIGAGSVVTRPIPAWSIALGSPARVTGTRLKPGNATRPRPNHPEVCLVP